MTALLLVNAIMAESLVAFGRLRSPNDRLFNGLCFVAGSRGAIPKAGDRIMRNPWGRINGFSAGGKLFVLAES